MTQIEAPRSTSEPVPKNILLMLWEKVNSIEDFDHWKATQHFPKEGLKLTGNVVGLGLVFDPDKYQLEEDHLLEMERPATGPGSPEWEEFSARVTAIQRKKETTGTAGMRVTDLKDGKLRRRDVLIRRDVDELQYRVIETDADRLGNDWYVFNPPREEFQKLFDESHDKRSFNPGELDEIVGLLNEAEVDFKNQKTRVC